MAPSESRLALQFAQQSKYVRRRYGRSAIYAQAHQLPALNQRFAPTPTSLEDQSELFDFLPQLFPRLAGALL